MNAHEMITTEELARIRAAAVGDMLGDSKAFDEMGPAATILRLCREVELAQKYALICELRMKDKPLKMPTELMCEAARKAVEEGR